MKKENTYIDKIILGGSHSLIIGHKPDKITLAQVAKKMEIEKQDISQNGFFDSSAPNFHTYYPDVTPEDLKPDPDTFIRPTFRALSEVVVHRKFNPIDFSKKGVIKASMNLLLNQTVNVDHETSVGNAIGAVAAVFFQDAYTTNGIKVPAGINVELLIDGKSHPNIARKIMMEPPAIHSDSVTVRFAWEPSHKFENIGEFLSKVGQFGKDGKLIRRIVTEILTYSELSLVGHGADPFAQVVKEDGKINNPEYAKSIESLSAQGLEKPRVYIFNYKTEVISLSKEGDDTSIPINKSQSTSKTMKEYLLKLAEQLGLKSEDIKDLDEKELQEEINKALMSLQIKADTSDGAVIKLTEANQKFEDEQTAHKVLKEQVKDLDLEKLGKIDFSKLEDITLEQLQENAKAGENALSMQLKEVERIYKLLKGDKTDDVILNGFKKADFKTLTSYIKEYAEQLDGKYPGKCNDCGGTNVARNSSITQEGLAGENKDDPPATKSDQDVATEFREMSTGKADHLHQPLPQKD